MKTEVHRVNCRDCNDIRQLDIGFANPQFTHTRNLARYVLDLVRAMTITDASKYLNLSWDIIKSI